MITSAPANQGGPYNLISGQATKITPAGQSAQQAYSFVVVYNNSQFQCQVQGLGGSQFLQPLQADVYNMPPGTGAVGGPIVTPLANSLANGIYCGTITATFLPLVSLLPPPGFPLPLTAYPGGQVPIAIKVLSTPTMGVITFAAPVGTSQVIIAIDGTGLDATITTLVGVQTGAVYVAGKTLDPGVPLTVPVSPADDTFDLDWTGVGLAPAPNLDIYASNLPVNPNAANISPVALPTPNEATASSGRISTTGIVIPAPTAGGLYLFGVDFFAQSAGGNAVISTTTEIGFLIAGAGGTGIFGDHTELNGLRTTAEVSVVFADATSYGLEVRFANGP